MGGMSKYFYPPPPPPRRSLQVDAGVGEGLKQLAAMMGDFLCLNRPPDKVGVY